jgi:hypothetical protein
MSEEYPKISRQPETAPAEAFALHLEVAYQDFEIMQDLLAGHLQIVAPEQKKTTVSGEVGSSKSLS